MYGPSALIKPCKYLAKTVGTIALRRHTVMTAALVLVRIAPHAALVVALMATSVTAQQRGARARINSVTEKQLDIPLGEQTSITAIGVKEFSVANDAIADVRVSQDGQDFIIVGLQPGETSLLLLTFGGEQVKYIIRVVGDAPKTPSAYVKEQTNIRLDFYFVRVAEAYAHQLGIAWPTSLGGGVFSSALSLAPASSLEASIAVADQALPQLDILQSTGWARQMSQSAVVTVNGGEAAVASGGEVNIPVQGSLAAEIRSVAFGSVLKFRPRYDAKTGRIEVSITADISELDDSRETGAPGRITSQLNTVVNLGVGQSIALAGVFRENLRKSKSGLPGLSQIPFLGGLFGTHRRDRELSRTVLFIIPTVLDNTRIDARRHLRTALELYWKFRGHVRRTKLLEYPKGVLDPSHDANSKSWRQRRRERKAGTAESQEQATDDRSPPAPQRTDSTEQSPAAPDGDAKKERRR